MTDPRNVGAEKQAAIEDIFKDLPATFPHIEFQLKALNKAFRTKIAEVFEPKLNEFLRSKQLSSASDYKQIANLVDYTLANLGLCLSIAGEPALLIAEGGSFEGEPHFSILTRRDGKPPYLITPLLPNPPTLTLMAAPDNIDQFLSPLRDRAYTSRGGL